MDEQVSHELRQRKQVEFILDGFLDDNLPTEAAAINLAALFPSGDANWWLSCKALMTIALQDLAVCPGQRQTFVAAISKMILDTWQEIETGKDVLGAIAALEARGRLVQFNAADNTFTVDDKGPFSFDDLLDEASRL